MESKKLHNKVNIKRKRWKITSRVLFIIVSYNKSMPTRLKGKSYKTIVRPTILFFTDCWPSVRKACTQYVKYINVYVKMNAW